MDRKDQIKAEAALLAQESLDALERGDRENSQQNVPKMQALLTEFCTLIPDGDHKESLRKIIAKGDALVANEGME